MNKFRVKLTFVITLILGLSVLVSGVLIANILERSQLQTIQETDSVRSKSFSRACIGEQDGNLEEKRNYFDSIVQELSQTTEARVTIIQADGTVLADSDHDPRLMENHLNREEIAEAGTEGTGYARRYSSTLQTNMLYLAVPYVQDNEIIGYFRTAISLEKVESVIRQLWTLLFTGLFILFLIAVFVSYRIAYGLTKPLENMTLAAQRISNLDYQARVEIRSRDEIGQLGKAINTMAVNLQRQVSRISENESRLTSVLENMVSGVMMVNKGEKIVLMNRSAEQILGASSKAYLNKKYSEVTLHPELKQMIERCMVEEIRIRDEMRIYYPEERILEINLAPMVQTNGQWNGVVIVMHDITSFQRLEEIRSEFVANVSRELKTPIASVKGFAETLLAGAKDDPETAESFLQIIYEESDRLNRLIGDILELSEIESKKITLEFSPIHLQEFVHSTLRMMDNEAANKGVELNIEVEPGLYIEADEDRLRQILINLISNGITYTPEQGKITVKAEPVYTGTEQEYMKVRITISDTGIGISKKDLPRIFERFYRVDKARSRSPGRTGLGLSIVKHLVELHHGSISVESAVGVGSTFIIELPVIQSSNE